MKSTWLKNVGAITLFVEDLQRSKLFYQDVFQLAVPQRTSAAPIRIGRMRGIAGLSGAIPRSLRSRIVRVDPTHR